MIAIVPNPIPAESGMCAVRVFTPETPLEQGLAGFATVRREGWPVWRVFHWTKGHAHLSAMACAHAPTLEDVERYLFTTPSAWVEILRKKEAT